MEEIYTTREAAQLLKIYPGTLSKWLHQGKIRATKVGKGWRIRKEELDALLMPGNEKQAAPEPLPNEQAQVDGRKSRAALLRGCLSHLPGGSEQFMRDKLKDIARESRPGRKKIR